MTQNKPRMNIADYVRTLIFKKYRVSFSKSGEDIQLYKLLSNFPIKHYVDVGCWHPINCSNTYSLYTKNWSGLAIDPNPEFAPVFKKYRSRDRFVNVGVGAAPGKLTYYKLDDKFSSHNTFNLNFLKEENVLHAIKQEIEIEIVTLENLFEELKFHSQFGLLDVDVEGFDLEVLKGNNWNKYRPKIVLVESGALFENEPNSEISLFLKEVGYGICAKLVQQPFESGNVLYYDQQ